MKENILIQVTNYIVYDKTVIYIKITNIIISNHIGTIVQFLLPKPKCLTEPCLVKRKSGLK